MFLTPFPPGKYRYDCYTFVLESENIHLPHRSGYDISLIKLKLVICDIPLYSSDSSGPIWCFWEGHLCFLFQI